MDNSGKAVGLILIVIGLVLIPFWFSVPIVAPLISIVLLIVGFYAFTMKKKEGS